MPRYISDTLAQKSDGNFPIAKGTAISNTLLIVESVEERDAIKSSIKFTGLKVFVAGTVNRLYTWTGAAYELDKSMLESLVGSAAPTDATEGQISQLYIDTTNKRAYICTSIVDTTYTWVQISGLTPEIQEALNAKQDTLTIDSIPTSDSGNPVSSGGTKTAINNVDNKVPTTTFSDTEPATAKTGDRWITTAGVEKVYNGTSWQSIYGVYA